jgi:thiamine-phosphate pyrophosphorylase
MTRTSIHGLYAITDGPRDDLIAACRAALAGGARVLQYRDKTGDGARRRAEALALAALCRDAGVPLIVNDDVELARAVGAAGVHLGSDDATLPHARRHLGASALIGVTCHASLERAREAAAAGADYLAFGAFFPSPTKPDAGPADPEILRAARIFRLPLVAIGGITADNGARLIKAGADALAVVSAVFAGTDACAAAQRISALFDPDPNV